MPQLNFVLPHWMYWGVLLLFPFIAMYLVVRQKRLGEPTGPSLFVAYLFWVCAGFTGLHRFYLRNAWGFVFIPVFLGILYVNDDIRDRLEDVSRTRAAYESAHLQANRIRPNPGVTLSPEATQRVATAQARETDAKGAFDAAAGQLAQRRSIARWLAILMAAMLLIDAVLLPGLVRRREVYEAAHPRVGLAAPVPCRCSSSWLRCSRRRASSRSCSTPSTSGSGRSKEASRPRPCSPARRSPRWSASLARPRSRWA